MRKAAITFQKQLRGQMARCVYRRLLEEKRRQEEEKKRKEEEKRYGMLFYLIVSGEQWWSLKEVPTHFVCLYS